MSLELAVWLFFGFALAKPFLSVFLGEVRCNGGA